MVKQPKFLRGRPFNWPRFPLLAELLSHIWGHRGPVLLPTQSRQVRPLAIQMAIMVALGCLAALSARAGFQAAHSWTADLSSAMTILVEAPRGDSDLSRAARVIRSVDGVSAATEMSRERARALLANYGANIGPLLDELPMPRLVEVGLKANDGRAKARIENALKTAGFTASVDDHSRYSGEILRTSAALRLIALIALALLVVATLASIAFAARAAIETHRDSVEIMHLVGAEDQYVAEEVQARFMRLGFMAGLIGAIAAGVLTFGVLFLLRLTASTLTSGSPLLRLWDVWILALAPFASAVVSAIAARLAARDALKELV